MPVSPAKNRTLFIRLAIAGVVAAGIWALSGTGAGPSTPGNPTTPALAPSGPPPTLPPVKVPDDPFGQAQASRIAKALKDRTAPALDSLRAGCLPANTPTLQETRNYLDDQMEADTAQSTAEELCAHLGRFAELAHLPGELRQPVNRLRDVLEAALSRLNVELVNDSATPLLLEGNLVAPGSSRRQDILSHNACAWGGADPVVLQAQSAEGGAPTPVDIPICKTAEVVVDSLAVTVSVPNREELIDRPVPARVPLPIRMVVRSAGVSEGERK